MVPAYFILMIFLLVVAYSLSTGNNQFAATASLIRQIWSGRCRSCPHSDYSGFSGLSGALDTNEASNLVGTSHNQDCVCDSCPCALVEDMLQKCSPVTTIMQEIANLLSQLFSYIVAVAEDLYEDYTRVMECRGTCQRQAEVLENSDDCTSGENFSFLNLDTAKKRSIGEVQPRKSSISFKIEPENKKEPSKKDDAKNKKPTKDTLKSNSASSETLKPSDSVSTSFCSKCKEKNKTCISSCPKSKK